MATKKATPSTEKTAGARAERAAFMREIRRMDTIYGPDAAISKLLEFGQKRAKRTAQRPGGVGRK